MDDSKGFLEAYLNSCAPPGREKSCRDLWIKYVEPFSDRIIRDSYGSVAAIQGNGPHTIVLEAHSDEIAWLVNYISPRGYIYVVKSGGSDPVIAPSKKVKIFSRNGIVGGIFALPSQGNRDNTHNAPETANLFIDVGCSRKDEVLDLGIEVGDPVLFDDPMTGLNERFYSGRALDNRIGGFVIAEVARRIRMARHAFPFAVAFVNAVQEEVGLHGAEMMAHRLRPNVAIVVDVVNDTNAPGVLKHEQGDIAVGRGPVLPTAPSVHPLLLEKLVGTARDRHIDFQRTAMARSTGADVEAFAYSRTGIPTGLICLPLKHMHTTVETVDKNDVEAAIELLYHFLLSLNFEELEAEGLFGSSYSTAASNRRSLDRSDPAQEASFRCDGNA